MWLTTARDWFLVPCSSSNKRNFPKFLDMNLYYCWRTNRRKDVFSFYIRRYIYENDTNFNYWREISTYDVDFNEELTIKKNIDTPLPTYYILSYERYHKTGSQNDGSVTRRQRWVEQIAFSFFITCRRNWLHFLKNNILLTW